MKSLCSVYNIAFEVSRTLSSNEVLGTIWGEKDDSEGVLYWLLDFNQQAKEIMKRHESGGWSKEDEGDVILATEVNEVADLALKISRRCITAKPIADLSVISMRERYQTKLGPLRFDSVDSMQNHYFLKKIPTAPTGLNSRLLFKELAAYRTALPVEYGSSCFCRVINNRLDLLRIMITGPDDTPYANGCFMFDISMPSNYPASNPKVQFLTTGGGRIRFNPNVSSFLCCFFVHMTYKNFHSLSRCISPLIAVQLRKGMLVTVGNMGRAWMGQWTVDTTASTHFNPKPHSCP